MTLLSSTTFCILWVAVVAQAWTLPASNITEENTLHDMRDKITTTEDNFVSNATDTWDIGDDGIPTTNMKFDANLLSNALQTAIKEAGHNGVSHDPCEAGFPCADDYWCARVDQRCRHCSDLDPWCNDTVLIHDSYTECEQYCHRQEMEKRRACETERTKGEERISSLESDLKKTESDLQDTTQQAAINMDRCSSEKKQAQHLYQEQYNILQNNANQIADLEEKVRNCTSSAQQNADYLEQCENTTTIAKERVRAEEKRRQDAEDRVDELEAILAGFQFGFGIMTVLLIGTVVAWIVYCVHNKRGKTPKTPLLPRQKPHHPGIKKPVPAERHSTHFSDHTHPADTYCLPGGGGYAHLPDQDPARA